MKKLAKEIEKTIDDYTVYNYDTKVGVVVDPQGWEPKLIQINTAGGEWHVRIKEDNTFNLRCMCLGTETIELTTKKQLTDLLCKLLPHNCIPWGG